MRVLAIDPGFERVGIAVLEKGVQREHLVYSACFTTSSKLPFEERLVRIGKELNRVIDEYNPDALAVETLLWNSNQKTAMRVAEARGVIVHTGVSRGLTFHEYTPLQIKVAVAGYGKAEKKQVASMVEKLLRISNTAKHDDETDAIALGITCLASQGVRGTL